MHDCSLQAATALKRPLQILFWNCSEKKACLQISRRLSKTFFSTDSSPEYFLKKFLAHRDFTEYKNVSEFKKVSDHKNFTEYKNVSEYKKVSEYKSFTEYKNVSEHKKVSKCKNFTEDKKVSEYKNFYWI